MAPPVNLAKALSCFCVWFYVLRFDIHVPKLQWTLSSDFWSCSSCVLLWCFYSWKKTQCTRLISCLKRLRRVAGCQEFRYLFTVTCWISVISNMGIHAEIFSFTVRITFTFRFSFFFFIPFVDLSCMTLKSESFLVTYREISYKNSCKAHITIWDPDKSWSSMESFWRVKSLQS